MKFDWSMVKDVKSRMEAMPSAEIARRDPQRFPVDDNSYPLVVEPGLSLLDFIRLCVPDDDRPRPAEFGSLYESIADAEMPSSVPSPRL